MLQGYLEELRKTSLLEPRKSWSFGSVPLTVMKQRTSA